jgi:hypothetical protein
MSKTAIGIILGLSLLVIAITAGFGWWWFNTQGRAYLEDAKTSYKEGQAAGARMNEQACMEAALEEHRTPEGSSMGGSLKNNLRFSGCLNKSSVLPTFCEGVPPPDEIMASARWSDAACKQHGFSDQYCPQLLQTVGKYCASPERAAKLKPAQ